MIQPGTLERGRTGGDITAEIFNGPVDRLNRMRDIGPARQVMPNPIPDAEAQASAIRTFIYAGQDKDFLVADDAKTGARALIALPVHLRVTPWDGNDVWHFRLQRRVQLFYSLPYWRLWQFDRRVARVLDTDPLEEYVEIVDPDWRWHGFGGDTGSFPIIQAARVGLDPLIGRNPAREGLPLDQTVDVIWADLNWEARGWLTATNAQIPVPEQIPPEPAP